MAHRIALDEYAVLDGDFRVRGVAGLRVVDASSWAVVPGYFVTTPFYMVSHAHFSVGNSTYVDFGIGSREGC